MFKEHYLTWPLVKLLVPLIVFENMPANQSWIIIVLVYFTYRHIIGLFMGLSPVPALDLVTLYDDDKSVLNVANISTFDTNSTDVMTYYVHTIAKYHKKSRSSIVKFGGDYYYKEMPIEKAEKLCGVDLSDTKTIDTEDQIKRFIEKKIATRMPFDAP